MKAVSDGDRSGQSGLYLHETALLFATPYERIMSVGLRHQQRFVAMQQSYSLLAHNDQLNEQIVKRSYVNQINFLFRNNNRCQIPDRYAITPNALPYTTQASRTLD